MQLRPKFYVASIGQSAGPPHRISPDGKVHLLYTVELFPVHRRFHEPENENSAFWARTPTGKIELVGLCESAIKGLEIGKEYFIEFRCAETQKVEEVCKIMGWDLAAPEV